MKSNVLVTGAAGLLGRPVVEELLRAGYHVRGLDLQRGDADIDWCVGDITDLAAVRDAVRGVDTVMHIAAIPNQFFGDAHTIMRTNVLGTYGLFESALAAGVSRVVFTSSDSVAGYTVTQGAMIPPLYAPVDESHPLNATDPYALSKVIGEQISRSFSLRGMTVVALRPVWVAYAEMLGEVIARANDPENYKGPVAGGRAPAAGGPFHHHVDPRDVARAFRLAGELQMEPGTFESFILSASTTLAAEPTLDRLRRLTGGKVPVKDEALYAREPYAPLYDLSHAAKRLGFVAEYNQRSLVPALQKASAD